MRVITMWGALLCALPAQKVTLPDQPVIFGAAFELSIDADAGFDPLQLAPLEVELLGQASYAGGVRLRYEARCYEVGEVTLALDPSYVLTVLSSLPTPSKELEWPSNGWQVEQSQSFLWLLVSLLVLASWGVLIWWRRYHRPSTVDHVPPSVAVATWDAMADLRALPLPADGDHLDVFYQQLKAIVRRHCAARFHLLADVRTSEELVQALPKLKPTLKPCLSVCDGVLFGRAPSDVAMHRGTRDQAILFVQATHAEVGEVPA